MDFLSLLPALSPDTVCSSCEAATDKESAERFYSHGSYQQNVNLFPAFLAGCLITATLNTVFLEYLEQNLQ